MHAAIRGLRTAAFAAALLLAVPAVALPPELAETFVKKARGLLGTPYNFGGRLRPSGPGIDCQGVIFAAAESVQPCGWKSFSVNSTDTVRTGELGKPIRGLSPVRTRDLDVSKLEPGDIVFLYSREKNPAEPAIALVGADPVWVWHTGIYSGEGKWIVGDHFAGEVIETPLRDYLSRHSNVYEGVYILRMDSAPAPQKCRRHPSMGAVKAKDAAKDPAKDRPKPR